MQPIQIAHVRSAADPPTSSDYNPGVLVLEREGVAMKNCVIGIAFALAANAHAATLCLQSCDLVPRPEPPEIIGPLVPREPVLVYPLPLLVLQPFQEGDSWVYAFNGPGSVISIEMPVFEDSDLSAIATPQGWSFSLDESVAGTMTATWHRDSATDAWWVLGFRSIHAPTLATYRFGLADGQSLTASLYIPWSPDAAQAGYLAFTSSVPEPGMGTMMALGLLVASACGYRRVGQSGSRA